MAQLGTKERPVIIKTNSESKIEKMTAVCDFYDLTYIVGIEIDEDLTDLKKAVKNKLEPADPYSECTCGSGKKYKFCCKQKMKNFDINRFIEDFEV
ncbi:hypothetical protein GCM10007063_31810 [Lentibacillus kapialis]|uniref:Uncharacterized protein n=1 Tax=Lentibacillus kapialis TaxID=340214 RepID=A0A917V170_9BACI|nr:DNA-binding protein [Lentibacillus kapialis]GGK06897.1 hypothetical protein GCM10007063_31810 [Lentibacillus kapialis]